ncbi:MAG: DUF1559 domain-containing protein [Planctomycetota bacterium]|nr:DUF1559 domain-containing protein [Planctomycetota bacterium]
MQCPACAERIPADTKFCPHCQVDVLDATPKGESNGHLSEGRNVAKTATIGIGVVLAVCLTGLIACGGVLFAVLLPTVRQAHEAARRAQCYNNLRQIGSALRSYHTTYGSFPPAVTYDSDGKPLHSWRVLILPFLNESALYDQFTLGEPWDSANNLRLQALMPHVFGCPSSSNPGTGMTHYLAISGNGTAFPNAKSVSIDEITDGLATTLLIGESGSASIPWTQPVDIDASNGLTFGSTGLGSRHTLGAYALMSDVTVKFISQNLNANTLNALSTIDGNEPVFDF